MRERTFSKFRRSERMRFTETEITFEWSGFHLPDVLQCVFIRKLSGYVV